MYLLHTVMFLAIFHRKAWYFTEKLGTSILQRKLIWYLFWVLCRESINCIISLRKSGVFFTERAWGFLQKTFSLFTLKALYYHRLYLSWPLTVHQPPTARRGWGVGSYSPWSSLCGSRRRVPDHGGTDLDCCSR